MDDIEQGNRCQNPTTKDNPRAKGGCLRGTEKNCLKDVQNLVTSVPRRVELVHKAKGWATKYSL